FYRNKSRKDKIIADQKIKQLEEEKKLLAARFLVEGQEEERKRIAKELHDGLGVLLSTARMQFTTIKDKSPENKQLIDKATKLLEQATGDVRKISHNMMPGLLTRFGLYEAAEGLIEQLDETAGLSATCEIIGDTKRLSENTEIMLYRIIQEMVNNTIKHADATRISLKMDILPELLKINYSDDGKGFNLEEKLKSKSIGLTSIQSRANFLSGKLDIESAYNKGAQFTLSVPI
ncbi:MAG: sensor histidine kinase, partial [Bacteroidales bacterium]|nr:sensor histidine kinase [Bacteroidales bacterium]